MPRVRARLSVCCLSGPPLWLTARVLASLEAVADEVVCAVDSRVAPEDLGYLEGVADRVVRYEYDPAHGIERNLGWLHSLCREDWVLRIDSDEVPSSALLAQLPGLTQADDVTQYLIRRRWLWRDLEHYLDEFPWSADWQIRLVRNDPALLRFPGNLHSSAELTFPHRYVDAPLYHLDAVLNSPEARREKARHNERHQPGLVTDRGFPVNGYYLPEDFDANTLSTVPTRDYEVIRATVSRPEGLVSPLRTDVPCVDLKRTDRYWALREVRASAYRAELQVLEPIETMGVGEERTVLVAVRNAGPQVWPWGDFSPSIRMATRWFMQDGKTLYADGVRTLFSANVLPGSVALQKMNVCAPLTPGDYILEFNLVHELVTWFDAGYRLPVKVSETVPHSYPEAKRSWLDHSALYDSSFFEKQAQGSRSSAHAVLDFVLSLPIGNISTALDVGCGVGTWVAELYSRGIDAIGVDGDYVERSLLQIPPERFAPHDLRKPLDLGRRFDLVISTEVIEHIEPSCETQFVESLTRHADLVLFSGAIPGQGGAHHVNERWPSHWTKLFAAQGYELFDIVRPALWSDRTIEWWYRQNVLLFARGVISTALSSVVLPRMPVMDIVHPEHRLIVASR